MNKGEIKWIGSYNEIKEQHFFIEFYEKMKKNEEKKNRKNSDEEELIDESDKTKVLEKDKVTGNITFEHVKFGYDEDKLIIKDFSAKAKSGEKIAIVGPTGAGKTTMVNLLMRFYEINSGDIKIDGVSTKELTRDNLHKLFCMVLQDTWLFNGTIKDNIIYNNPNVTLDEVKKSCETV